MTDPRVAEVLKSAGWTPARRVDPSGDVAALSRCGYEVTEAVHVFLSKYSGLVIERGVDNPNRIHLGGQEGVLEADHYWCKCYSAMLGKQLVPIGWVTHVTLLVDPSGTEFWGGVEHEYGLIGESFEQFIAAQLDGNRTPKLNCVVPKGGEGLNVPVDDC